jgi:hypothetical protein
MIAHIIDLILIVAVALLLAGCGGDENFDTMTCAQYMELSKKPGVDAGFIWAQEYVRTMNKEYGRGETMLSVSDQRGTAAGLLRPLWVAQFCRWCEISLAARVNVAVVATEIKHDLRSKHQQAGARARYQSMDVALASQKGLPLDEALKPPTNVQYRGLTALARAHSIKRQTLAHRVKIGMKQYETRVQRGLSGAGYQH